MMVLFFQAARLAMVTFDPYLSSRPLAEALVKSPHGQVDRGPPLLFFLVGLLLYEPVRNITERPLDESGIWLLRSRRAQRLYRRLTIQGSVARAAALLHGGQAAGLPRLEGLVGDARLNVVATSGGKILLTNHPLAGGCRDLTWRRLPARRPVEW